MAGLEAQQAYRTSSMDELSARERDVSLADRLGDADVELDQVEYRETLLPLLDELSERDRTILMLRFFANQTQTQIAGPWVSPRCTSPGCSRRYSASCAPG